MHGSETGGQNLSANAAETKWVEENLARIASWRRSNDRSWYKREGWQFGQ
jgi:hypothetical protein